MYVLKPFFYDDFKCIADRCTYTCCRDWNISVDSDTYSKYIKESYICEHCTVDNKTSTAKINLDEDGVCPFLDDKGLCGLIKHYGEDILSDTCKYFPRAELYRGDSVEQSLSNACPAVLDYLYNSYKPMYYIMEEYDFDSPYSDDSRENYFKCRDFLIDLIQVREMPLRIRLYMTYIFSEHVEENKENVDSYIQWFEDSIANYYEQLLKIKDNILLKVKYCLEIFLYCNGNDVITYYGYKKYIHNIKRYIDGLDYYKLTREWSTFINDIYDGRSNFFENICVNNLFKNSINYNNDYSFHTNILIMLLESVMIQFTIFLWWMSNDKKIAKTEILEIACYYARIMEHNRRNMLEFIYSLKNAGYLDHGIMYILLR